MRGSDVRAGSIRAGGAGDTEHPQRTADSNRHHGTGSRPPLSHHSRKGRGREVRETNSKTGYLSAGKMSLFLFPACTDRPRGGPRRERAFLEWELRARTSIGLNGRGCRAACHRASPEPQLPAHHVCIQLRPAVVTDGPPLPPVVHLQAALVAVLPPCESEDAVCEEKETQTEAKEFSEKSKTTFHVTRSSTTGRSL